MTPRSCHAHPPGDKRYANSAPRLSRDPGATVTRSNTPVHHYPISRPNAYLAHKRDTDHLLCWAVHASNGIARSPLPRGPRRRRSLTLSGRRRFSLSMAELIVENTKRVPSFVLRLFGADISARLKSYTVFRSHPSFNPDLEMANASNDVMSTELQILAVDDSEAGPKGLSD